MENSKIKIMRKTAERIKELRIKKGLSQKSLAICAGMDPAFLGHIERSLKCPTVDTLNKISNALNISLSELLDFDNDKIVQDNEKALNRIYMLLNRLDKDEAMQVAEIIEKIVRFKLD
jgi:transcriptional regulator with XRE-family HTH domain